MNKSYYFSHDYAASNDVKILFLRQQLGMEGYGIYWFLVENLAQAGGLLPMNITPVLAMQMQTNEVKVKAVIEEFNLFTIAENGFFSKRLTEHLEMRKKLSDKGKIGATLRWKNGGAIGVANGEGYAKKESKEINNRDFLTKIVL
jgi:uncharacterized protein YdaU (DUF1376 family)